MNIRCKLGMSVIRECSGTNGYSILFCNDKKLTNKSFTIEVDFIELFLAKGQMFFIASSCQGQPQNMDLEKLEEKNRPKK